MTKNTKIRTRFAPSPTGYVHVGSIRTALYCYLFAKNQGGDYILRIEDTDQSRKVDGAVENLLSVMKSMGIEHSEGPDIGGDYGPYFQSKRLDIYKQHIEKLLADGTAYKCFCSSDRLEQMRARQEANGEDPRYDRHCLSLSKEEIANKENNEAYVIRMKVPDTGITVVEDMIRGRVEFQNNTIDDQILMKSDGFPTYHFANIVDDHLMAISHVIRGEEWLPSTPKHILLYQFMGWDAPLFAHLPLLLNPDRKKLSKRQGDVSVEDFLNKGYLKPALLNFLSLLGWHAASDEEMFSMEELISEFSIERVNKAGAVFDREKLLWFNGEYLKNRISEDEYLETVNNALEEQYADCFAADKLKLLLLALRPKLTMPGDINQQIAAFTLKPEEFDFTTDELKEVAAIETNPVLYQTFLGKLQDMDYLGKDEFKATVKACQKEARIKGKNLFMPLRLAISGQLHGPDLTVYAELFGIEGIKQRLSMALERL